MYRNRFALPPTLVGLGALAIVIAGGWTGGAPAAAASGAMACLLSAWHYRIRRKAGPTATTQNDESAETEQIDVGRDAPGIGHRQRQRHPVTSLPTREPLLARIDTDAAGQLGVIEFADYDRLHAFDEQLAQQAINALADRLRKMTTSNAFLAQVDRARFAVWYGGSQPAAEPFAAMCYAAGDEIVTDGQRLIPVLRTALIGYPADAASPSLLLGRAFAALGHDETTNPIEVAREVFGLEQDLRNAVSRQELSLEFQPLIDAAAGRVCGAEALLRWQHPHRGKISPAVFVPVMEQAGLAQEIGGWVLDRALREARRWRAAGQSGLRIAINVSGHQLHREGFGDTVARALARHRLDAGALEIELTETAATGSLGQQLLARLRALGVAIAIDDFGTGYSSLSTLRTLPFDKIKIDREFVTLVDRRRDSQAICRSILALGHGLGIRVLAEGVERAEEYTWLRRHGCTHFQGFYFAKPLSAARFHACVNDPAWLADKLGKPMHPERLCA